MDELQKLANKVNNAIAIRDAAIVEFVNLLADMSKDSNIPTDSLVKMHGRAKQIMFRLAVAKNMNGAS